MTAFFSPVQLGLCPHTHLPTRRLTHLPTSPQPSTFGNSKWCQRPSTASKSSTSTPLPHPSRLSWKVHERPGLPTAVCKLVCALLSAVLFAQLSGCLQLTGLIFPGRTISVLPDYLMHQYNNHVFHAHKNRLLIASVGSTSLYAHMLRIVRPANDGVTIKHPCCPRLRAPGCS
jgi:hypothetical protein